jgi:NAD(P)-dependent dehydrogenase (short-subunit alcohol dehydrogenase family)
MSVPDLHPMDLNGRRFLITGAGSGIGRATAVLLSHLGARVACADIDNRGLEESLSLLNGGGHCALVYDFRDLNGIAEWLGETARNFGTLHGFVHAAGIPAPWPLRSLSVELWREALTVNTEAALLLTKAFQGRKIYAGENGSVVFISSVMGSVGSAAASVYSMTKAALDGMGRSLAIELAGRKIRVNCVAPAFVRTPMLERVGASWDSEQRAAVEALHPLGLGFPEDIANAVAFLLADTGRWITGTVLIVDGGYTAQ